MKIGVDFTFEDAQLEPRRLRMWLDQPEAEALGMVFEDHMLERTEEEWSPIFMCDDVIANSVHEGSNGIRVDLDNIAEIRYVEERLQHFSGESPAAAAAITGYGPDNEIFLRDAANRMIVGEQVQEFADKLAQVRVNFWDAGQASDTDY